MTELCQNCECYYDTVYRVPDAVWLKLTGQNDGGGLLCPACCDLLARQAGIELFWEAGIAEYPITATAPDLLAVLKAVEWLPLHQPGNRLCPWCGGSQAEGHQDGCPRQAVIAKAEGI